MFISISRSACLAIARTGLADDAAVCDRFFRASCDLAMLPDTAPVLDSVAASFGFVKMPRAVALTGRQLPVWLEDTYPGQAVCALCVDTAHYSCAKVTAVLPSDGGRYVPVEPLPEKLRTVYVRWPDGLDHSGLPPRRPARQKAAAPVPDSERFVFYNANPRGISTTDCVIRAISVATGKTYQQTLQLLFRYGAEDGRRLNDERLYWQPLEDLGFHLYWAAGKHATRFAQDLDQTYTAPVVAELQDHLTALLPTRLEDGRVFYRFYDIWDVSSSRILHYLVGPEK